MNAETISTIMVIAGPLLVLLYRYLKSKWAWLDEQCKKTKLDEIAEGAAAETWEAMGRALKAKAKESPDGKLTSEQKKDLMKMAVQTFRDSAKEAGLVDEAKNMAAPIIKGLIEKGINRLKKSAADSKPAAA